MPEASSDAPDVINGLANATNQVSDVINEAWDGTNDAWDGVNQASVIAGKGQKVPKTAFFTLPDAVSGQKTTFHIPLKVR